MTTHNYKPTNQTASKINNYRSPHEGNSQKSSVQKLAPTLNGYQTHMGGEKFGYLDDGQDLKAQNTKLKKMLKEAQAKRIQITKQCSELANKFDKLEEQNMQLHRRIKDVRDVGEGEKFRYEQLKFLNKQLAAQIQQLQKQNVLLNDKLKHHTDILEKKYEEIEERTYKRIEQALKRIKKAIHYLSSLTTKQIQKTKEIQIQNLVKAADVLKGKYSENSKFQQEIEELMNPIRNIQEELHEKVKQIALFKQQNARLNNQLKKHKKIEKQVLPQYKEAIEKLKKNLGQVRTQLSENQYDKLQVKRKYEEKLKEMQLKYEDLFTEHRKLKLQNKIFQKKIEQIQDDVQEEKQRLIGENELLKKLYKSEDQKSRRSIQKDLGLEGIVTHKNEEDQDVEQEYTAFSYKTATNQFRKPIHQYLRKADEEAEGKKSQTKIVKGGKQLKKNYSASQLHPSTKMEQKEGNRMKQRGPLKLTENPMSKYGVEGVSQSRHSNRSRQSYGHLRHGHEKRSNQQMSQNQSEISDEKQNQWQENNQNWENQIEGEDAQYRQQASGVSGGQDGLKNQIFKIDQEIMEIQKTLDRELNMYK